MAFNSQITRSDAQSLMPEEAAREIIKNVPEQSAVLRLARRLPNMSRAQTRMPVLASLITAGFVSGDTGLKATSEVSWTNKYINAAELAVIVPIPENVLSDVDYDIWGEIRPLISEAMGVAIDQAILFGTNAPSDWPEDILDGATSAANVVTLGSGDDLYDEIMGESGVIAKVEEDGFFVNGHVAALTMRGRLRNVRSSDGIPIFRTDMVDATRYLLDGQPIEFPRNGGMDAAQALMFSGDWDQLVFSMRQDLTYKILTEAVIQDQAGNILYNLAQQDMVALRAVMRLGWQLPNPINRIQSTEASRYPFSVLLPA